MFFDTGDKTECFGCEACLQICSKSAIHMQEDSEGFRYPVIDLTKCIHCGMCRSICPHEHMPDKNEKNEPLFRSSFFVLSDQPQPPKPKGKPSKGLAP